MQPRDYYDGNLVVLNRLGRGCHQCVGLTRDEAILQIANVSLTQESDEAQLERNARLAEKVLRASGIKKVLGAMLNRAQLADKWVATKSLCRPKDMVGLLKAFLRKVVLPSGLLGKNFKRFVRMANLILSRLVFHTLLDFLYLHICSSRQMFELCKHLHSFTFQKIGCKFQFNRGELPRSDTIACLQFPKHALLRVFTWQL